MENLRKCCNKNQEFLIREKDLIFLFTVTKNGELSVIQNVVLISLIY